MARILIIEDDATSRSVLRAMLESAGHMVAEAADGGRGLEMYRADPPDMVITDIYMPEKEGVEIVRELRRDFPDARIIAVSGGGERGVYDPLEWLKMMGVKHTFIKPYERKEILSAVDSLLAEK